MKRALFVAATTLVLAACSQPPPPEPEASPRLAGIGVNGAARAVGSGPETVTAAGWSCEMRPGPYGFSARCTFGETDASVSTVVHCEHMAAPRLGGADDARLELWAICSRPDGTCFDNRFAPLGGSATVECPSD